MTQRAFPNISTLALRRNAAAPFVLAAVAFAVLFQEAFTSLLRDWWNDPDAGHGLLLGPLALYLAWRSGVVREPRRAVAAGLVVLGTAVTLRYVAGLAAELSTLRLSMLLAVAGMVLYLWGWGQLRRWWLPAGLLLLSVPVPAVLMSTLAMPLQLKASAIGAGLLEWRHVPVLLAGNVIRLPGRELFVTEACSGLRSLTALVSLGLLCGGLWLRTPAARAALLLLVLPVGILVNGVRVFLTGFLVHFVDPALGEGFMHYTEGWALFLVSFSLLGLATFFIGAGEGWVLERWTRSAPESAGRVREAVA